MSIVSRRPVGVLLGGALLMILAACGEGEDRPRVDVMDGSVQTVSVSATGFDSSVLGPLGARYAIAGDVESDEAIALDLRDIRDVMAPAGQSQPVDWAAARAIYEEGKNQTLPSGELRALQTLATGPANGVFPDAATLFGSTNHIDAIIRDGLDGTGHAEGTADNARRQMVDRGVQMLMYGVALEQLAEARSLIEAGDRDAADGAPHHVDVAWATIAGAEDADGSRTFGLLQTALTREVDFGLISQLYIPLETAFMSAQRAANDGDLDAFDDAYAEIEGGLNAIFYLSVLRNAQVLRSDTTPIARETLLADGWTYFQTIRPALASVSAEAAATVEGVYELPADQPIPATAAPAVYEALNTPAALQRLGIPRAVTVTELPAQ